MTTYFDEVRDALKNAGATNQPYADNVPDAERGAEQYVNEQPLKSEDTLSIGKEPPVYTVDSNAPDASLLETFQVKGFERASMIRIINERDEFSCLCPATGQPDFARIEVVYTPTHYCLESRSWKLYLCSFRSTRMFHEQIVCHIYNDLCIKLRPKFLRVVGHFTPRGGISFMPVRQSHAQPNADIIT